MHFFLQNFDLQGKSLRHHPYNNQYIGGVSLYQVLKVLHLAANIYIALNIHKRQVLLRSLSELLKQIRLLRKCAVMGWINLMS